MYFFDHRIEAKSVTKERLVWMLYMGLFFFLLYGATNQYAGLSAPHTSFFMEWETQIPFVEAFIVPYMSSDIMFIIAFFLPYSRLELRILAARVLFIVAISCLFFLIVPLQFSFEKPGIMYFTFLFSMLEADLPFNQLPSLHISFAIVLWDSMRKQIANKWIKAFTALWLWLIALSTLLVYQHHFIDLPTGALLGFLAIYFIGDKEAVLTHSFTTPRSLKMALYYVIGASIFMVLTFILSSSFSYLTVYISLSLLAISVIYAFGLNKLLAGKDANASWLQWAIFAPYFLGNTLSWTYYKRKLPLMQVLKDNVYLGRYPDKEEYRLLEDKGIAYSINLATEQQVQKQRLAQKRFAFLDQTIQSPDMLHMGVLEIEAHKDKGVYVHCTLGLSRSVLLASAWLLFNGYTLEEAEAVILKVRPQYVKSPYMKITLEMYQEYLKKY